MGSSPNSTPTVAPEDVRIRPATSGELLSIMRILDGAMLAIEDTTVETRIEAGEVLVAVREATDHVCGVIVTETGRASVRRIEALAVRSPARGQGIGTALVEAITDDSTPIVAEFDASVHPFYRALGFEIEPVAETDRFRGRYDPSPDT